MAPVISFLVCTRNRATVVYDCVRKLLDSDRDDFEVVVRDNCSTDNTLDILRGISDSRLRIHVAPENQGTRTFYEISRLARGDLVTWLSDEDNFQFSEMNFVVDHFRRHPNCNVMFGAIVVGAKQRRVEFRDEEVVAATDALITGLSFSGCGGLFVRRSALAAANSFDVVDSDDAYALWNYYPVGFFASRCMTRSIATTSRVVVVQSRFASTTNNWSKLSSGGAVRVPHYYPESVVDRLATNIVNVFSRSLPLQLKIKTAARLVQLFWAQVPSFSDTAFHQLLRENYSDETVENFRKHIKDLKLSSAAGRQLWFMRKVIFSLPGKLANSRRQWCRLQSNKVY